ncbi:MAG: cell envelope biogenesis protein OmpA [Gammaproteobacteria bacterium]|nr:MAG: cell envelope biogenesis protein OmpA [Gammaproteobacteria bacterium]
MKFQKTLLAVAMVGTLTGCTMTQNQKTAVGAGVGAVVGGVLGHQVNDKNGRYVGAVLGALAGAAIGRYMTQQQQELEKVLASSGINVTRVDDATIKLNLPESITFAVDKSNLNPAVYPSLNQIAAVLNKYPKTAVHVLGFTDSTGSDEYNMGLSQRRAQAAASYLASQGVVQGRLAVRGYGEGYPIADNGTASGRAQNRRAEIYIRAIEKGNEQAAYNPIY